jgi:hypothetical protein
MSTIFFWQKKLENNLWAEQYEFDTSYFDSDGCWLCPSMSDLP